MTNITIEAIPVGHLAELKRHTSMIQDAKRDSILGRSSARSERLSEELRALEDAATENPYVRLDLEYLRDRSSRNRSFAYVVTYDTFVAPRRSPTGEPDGQPELTSVVKLGDGGRGDGRSAGVASGSIISRVVRSYWEEANVYNAVLRGVVIPGNDSRISRKIATRVGGWGLRVRGDLWQAALLDRMSVSELLELMAA